MGSPSTELWAAFYVTKPRKVLFLRIVSARISKGLTFVVVALCGVSAHLDGISSECRHRKALLLVAARIPPYARLFFLDISPQVSPSPSTFRKAPGCWRLQETVSLSRKFLTVRQTEITVAVERQPQLTVLRHKVSRCDIPLAARVPQAFVVGCLGVLRWRV